jgi:hypothetical protein
MIYAKPRNKDDEKRPFATEQSAAMSMSKQGIEPDEYQIIEVEGGFAVCLSEIGGAPDEEADEAPKEPKAEKFFWAEFNPASDKREPEQVKIVVNGTTIQIPRGVRCPIPERYLEAARNTRIPIYKHVKGQGRVYDRDMQRFTFSTFGEATKEEYDQYIREMRNRQEKPAG